MLDDPKQSPYMKLIDIDPEFGVAVIRLGFVSRRFPDYVPQTTSSISISLPERN